MAYGPGRSPLIKNVAQARRDPFVIAFVALWMTMAIGYFGLALFSIHVSHVSARASGSVRSARDPQLQTAFTPAVINGGRVGNLPNGDDLSVGTGSVVAGSHALNAGPTWTAGSTAPSGSCTDGSFYSNTSGGVTSTLFACTATNTWTALAPVLTTGSLAITNATQSAGVNLSTVGTGQLDWMFQSDDTASRVYDSLQGDFEEKLTGGAILASPGIDSLGAVGTITQVNGAFTFTSTAADTLSQAALSSSQGTELNNAAVGSGFRFVAPASTTQRVLRIYNSHNSATMVCTAHLQDGSAADQSITSNSGSGTNVQEIQTVTFTAASSTYLIVNCIFTAVGSGTPNMRWYAEVLSAA